MKTTPRKRRAAIIALGALVITVLMMVFWPGPKVAEPEYEGKKLSAWLEMRSERPQESAQAIRSIGTSAVPLLTRWVEFELPAWRVRLLRIYARFPGALRNNKVGAWVVDSEAQMRAASAVYGFEVLGVEARSAVPELARFIANPGKLDYSRITLALAHAGEGEAVAPLLTALSNNAIPAIRRTSFASALAKVTYRGPGLKQAIPVLISCVQETNQFVPSVAANALGTFAIDPEVCVPALSNAASSPDFRLRRNSIRALGEFGLAASSVANVVSNAMNDPDQNVRKEATNAALKIAFSVKTNRMDEGHE